MTLSELDWEKADGLMPAIVQDADSGAVLMMGYMNREALNATQKSGRVTFWSRSKGRLWTKGETSGHFLELRSLAADCDGDALLVLAQPSGPACHLGTATCWGRAHRNPWRNRWPSSRSSSRSFHDASPTGRPAATPQNCWIRGSHALRKKSARRAWNWRLLRSRSPTLKSSAKPRTSCITCCYCSKRRGYH